MPQECNAERPNQCRYACLPHKPRVTVFPQHLSPAVPVRAVQLPSRFRTQRTGSDPSSDSTWTEETHISYAPHDATSVPELQSCRSATSVRHQPRQTTGRRLDLTEQSRHKSQTWKWHASHHQQQPHQGGQLQYRHPGRLGVSPG